jgi:hypothetical protein
VGSYQAGDFINSFAVEACELLDASNTETAPTFLRFAAIKCFERVKDARSLTPEVCFIPTETIERKIGQIDQLQKAAGEFDSVSVGVRPGVGHRLYVTNSIMRPCMPADGFGAPENCVNNVARILEQFAIFAIVTQMSSTADCAS